ncbi:MAG: hypothetical protein K0U66_07450 [Gammaproteobacteria bacterium]|nr:hypothetical protein [Gammaproteobacteria bacterium]
MTQTAPKDKPAKRSKTSAVPKGKQDKPPLAPKVTLKPVPTGDMEELWNTAQTYGRTRLYSHSDGTISCHIEMINAQGIELTAKSSYKLTNAPAAIQDAIVNARKVRGISVEGGE